MGKNGHFLGKNHCCLNQGRNGIELRLVYRLSFTFQYPFLALPSLTTLSEEAISL